MQTYDRVQGDETAAYIKARIFNGAEAPEAELHYGGPETDGTVPIPVPSTSMPVPEALERGEEIALEEWCSVSHPDGWRILARGLGHVARLTSCASELVSVVSMGTGMPAVRFP